MYSRFRHKVAVFEFQVRVVSLLTLSFVVVVVLEFKFRALCCGYRVVVVFEFKFNEFLF